MVWTEAKKWCEKPDANQPTATQPASRPQWEEVERVWGLSSSEPRGLGKRSEWCLRAGQPELATQTNKSITGSSKCPSGSLQSAHLVTVKEHFSKHISPHPSTPHKLPAVYRKGTDRSAWHGRPSVTRSLSPSPVSSLNATLPVPLEFSSLFQPNGTCEVPWALHCLIPSSVWVTFHPSKSNRASLPPTPDLSRAAPLRRPTRTSHFSRYAGIYLLLCLDFWFSGDGQGRGQHRFVYLCKTHSCAK